MSKTVKILTTNPSYALPGGEIIIECENFQISENADDGCYFDGQKARLVGASSNRILAVVPDNFDAPEVEIHLECGGERSESVTMIVAERLVEDLHMVANPAIDPKDDSIIVTRSGSRGQQLPVTLLRLESDGYLHEMSAEVLNPTGVAFDSKGQLFATNRANGEVYRINNDSEVAPFASDLGIATGLAFDREGEMYVGDRSGTIYQIKGFGSATAWATLEPSVSAFHLAFDLNGNLCVSAPGLSSYDSIHRFDTKGNDKGEFYRGLGRPQGLAFDIDGNLYVAACLRGKRGIVKISTQGEAKLFVSGMNVIGLCFNRKGEMIVATSDAIYRLPLDIYGTLLNN